MLHLDMMTMLDQTALIFIGALVAGLLGALTGLGGGVVIIPMLTMIFHVDIRYAIGASLVSVIATSSGAASAYVKEGFTNLRIGMFLEIATVIGALVGSFLATMISTSWIYILFGIILLQAAYFASRPRVERSIQTQTSRMSTMLKLDGAFPFEGEMKAYHVHALPAGFGLMTLAGALSGLLGIGSGAMKVIAMDQVMRIPFKVSTTTSNFMIGVTAAASAAVYLNRGYIDPGLAMPVVLGVLTGSILGSHLLVRVQSKILRLVFSLVITLLGIEMLLNGIFGGL